MPLQVLVPSILARQLRPLLADSNLPQDLLVRARQRSPPLVEVSSRTIPLVVVFSGIPVPRHRLPPSGRAPLVSASAEVLRPVDYSGIPRPLEEACSGTRRRHPRSESNRQVSASAVRPRPERPPGICLARRRPDPAPDCSRPRATPCPAGDCSGGTPALVLSVSSNPQGPAMSSSTQLLGRRW